MLIHNEPLWEANTSLFGGMGSGFSEQTRLRRYHETFSSLVLVLLNIYRVRTSRNKARSLLKCLDMKISHYVFRLHEGVRVQSITQLTKCILPTSLQLSVHLRNGMRAPAPDKMRQMGILTQNEIDTICKAQIIHKHSLAM